AAGDANLYRYVGNGVTTKTDPSGLVEFPGSGYDPILNPPIISPRPVSPAGTPSHGQNVDDALNAIQGILPRPSFFGTNTCERFVFQAEPAIRNLRHPAVASVEVVTFALFPNADAPWYVQLTLSTGHAAVKVMMQDGRVFYFDNGGFGGSDGMFQSPDIPSYAYPGEPSYGILEDFGQHWNTAYPVEQPPGSWDIFDACYGP
ncbi:MAG TPA: hypothetical protein DDZ51_20360, partial [Planctomycetaceae bacterium]|nr:hypothetical protein [Planctomycetaceae bacterium]